MNQRCSELEAIRKAVTLYSDGIHNGNIEMLRAAFHPKAMMYSSTGKELSATEIEGLYSFVSANQSPSVTGEPHKSFISEIRYAGNAAFVEMIEEAGYGHDYINYFQLAKLDENWVIVSKTYNATPVGK